MAGMTAEDKRGPGLKFPPPLLAVLMAAAAWLIDSQQPLPITSGGGLWLGGGIVIGLALTIALLALVQFLAHKTHVEPWHPTTAIIQNGLYRFSRNPIYLAFCIATVGVGLLLNSWWIVASSLPLKSLLQRLVIQREEAYLERKFGQDYLEYKRRVRRWI